MKNITPIEVYETDFSTVKLTGFSNYLLPYRKPDYRKERQLYKRWKRRADERSNFETALNDFCRQVYVMGGTVREIVVE
jgi:hypothetical protein